MKLLARVLCVFLAVAVEQSAPSTVTLTSTATVTRTRFQCITTVTTTSTEKVQECPSTSTITTFPPSLSCSQSPVPTTTPDTSLPILKRETNIISMTTMGVLTGILLLALVTVTAGWIRTCVRGRAPAQSLTDTAGDHPTEEADISVEKNEAYGGVVRHTQLVEREYEHIYDN